MSDALPPAERLLNLVIALMNTTGRMTKEQIRRSVAGYDTAPSTEAFERMFERDKETLRDLGVPVLTVTSAAHGDDLGYRIDPDAYALPPIDLTPAQLGVLALAAEFWHGQTLGQDAARALTKLRAVAPSGEGSDAVAGLAPRLRPAGPALAPLLDAARERRVVRFTYRTASSGEVLEREVEPWRIVAQRGGWYLVGHDRRRDAPRVYRLSRIEGSVRAVGRPGAFEPPDGVDAAGLVDVARRAEQRTAWLAVAPERAGALRARSTADPATPVDPPEGLAAPPGTDLVGVPYTSTAELASEVVGYTDAVVVLAPDDLRDAVVRRLRAAAALAEVPRG